MLRRDCLKALALAPAAWAAGKPRFRPAICAYSFRKQLADKSMTYADVIRMAADTGADGVDLTTYWLPDTTDRTLYELRKQAYRAGVSLYTIGVRARMAQPTAELQAAEVATVKQWLDAPSPSAASSPSLTLATTPASSNAVAWAVETLKRAAEEAGKRGIILGVEDDGGITTNADRTVEIVTKAASPWVGINLDIGNFPDNGYEQIAMCAPHATNVHFKTAVRVNKQKQEADWPRVLKILGAAGYQGYLSLEYEEEADPVNVVPRLIAKMRETIRAA
jgi:sugar phosphate isomerase/epimerase